MARFRGRAQGIIRDGIDGLTTQKVSRQGSAGVDVLASCPTGDIVVRMWAPDDASSTDMVHIFVRKHAFATEFNELQTLYNGPMRNLMEKGARNLMIKKFAEDALRQRCEQPEETT